MYSHYWSSAREHTSQLHLSRDDFHNADNKVNSPSTEGAQVSEKSRWTHLLPYAVIECFKVAVYSKKEENNLCNSEVDGGIDMSTIKVSRKSRGVSMKASMHGVVHECEAEKETHGAVGDWRREHVRRPRNCSVRLRHIDPGCNFLFCHVSILIRRMVVWWKVSLRQKR